MRNPEHSVSAPENCTGCGLCADVCPRGAIEMVWSEEGFLIPKVDADACVNCGLCLRRCPACSEVDVEKRSLPHGVCSFGAWHRMQPVHSASSSGGVFTALAQYAFECGGCVFGVMWSDVRTAVFGKAENMQELNGMRGAKYTQAVPNGVYRRVKKELATGRFVLFCGTPCQVNALRRFLNKEYQNLLCVDLVCHGVPSRKLLESYVRENEGSSGKEMVRVEFRRKDDCWNDFNVCRIYSDGSEQSACFRADTYMQLFLSDRMLNRACYNCAYAHFPRCGDFSMGDYWGVEKFHPEWPIRSGVSTLLVNTEKGKTLLESLKRNLHFSPEPFANIYRGQPSVYDRPPTEIPQDRAYLISRLGREPLSRAAYRALYCRRYCGIYLNRNALIVRVARRIKKLIRRAVKGDAG